MSDELRQLETNIEAALTGVAPLLDVPTDDVIRERARVAVSAELGQAWLATHADPEPSAVVTQNVRTAVRSEQSAGSPALWRGAFAAAALITLAMGLSYFILPDPSNQHPDLMVEETSPTDAFAAYTEEVLNAESFTDEIEADLASLEERVYEWQTSWDEWDIDVESIDSDGDSQSRGINQDARRVVRRETVVGRIMG